MAIGGCILQDVHHTGGVPASPKQLPLAGSTMSQSEFNEWFEWEVQMDMAQFEEELGDTETEDET